MKKTLKEKIIHAEERASHFLAEGNEAVERNSYRSEMLYEKAQVWLDRYNELAGNT